MVIQKDVSEIPSIVPVSNTTNREANLSNFEMAGFVVAYGIQ
jgi:hypothetical protein